MKTKVSKTRKIWWTGAEPIFEQAKKERNFLVFVIVALFLAGIFYPYPQIAMWIGFALAAYSAIANDSIQTIGTFIASNGFRPWWQLWLYIGVIFVATVTVSWIVFDGDVTYARLSTKGFSEAPTSFQFLHLAAPIVLLIVTRLRMPVSTTFMLLSAFSTKGDAILGVGQKSLLGYAIAIIFSFLIWLLFSRAIRKMLKGKAHIAWDVAQWITSGTLWSIWIMQDAANIAVFLPRQLSIYEFLAFTVFIFLGLGLLFYMKGDKIQKVVDEKTEITDVRAATLVDLVYTIILVVFQWMNTVPMSTTWVFIGLLAGRELGMEISKHKKISKKTLKLIRKDVFKALAGLVISIAIAVAVNPIIRKELAAYLDAIWPF